MNSYWKSVKLTEIASKRRWAMNGGPFGSKLSRKHYSLDGVPVIRGCNLPEGAKFSFKDFVYVSEEKADELAANNAHPGDLVFTQRGTLGQVGLIPLDSPFPRFVISQSQMKLTVDGDLADPTYLYHVFSSPAVVQAIHNLAFSSGVPHINLDILRNFQVDLPPLPVQRRIAGILSSYDNLIENSQRRIRILEEMARRLYRECFINGQAPTAWPAEQLGHFFELKRGYDLPARDRRPGLFPIVSSSGITGFHEAFMARGPGIVTGRYGTLGEVHLVWDEFWPLNTSLYVKDFKGTPFLYVFWLLRHVLPGQKGSAAAVPGLNRNDLHSLLINTPPLSVMQNFHNLCLPLANQTRFLAESIQNLRRTRDLLLPRLLSGQIDVEVLPEPALSEP